MQNIEQLLQAIERNETNQTNQTRDSSVSYAPHTLQFIADMHDTLSALRDPSAFYELVNSDDYARNL